MSTQALLIASTAADHAVFWIMLAIGIIGAVVILAGALAPDVPWGFRLLGTSGWVAFCVWCAYSIGKP